MPPDGPDCKSDIGPAVTDHIERLALEGWAAVNGERQLRMLGCAAGDEAIDCLGEFPLAADTDYGASWAVRDTSIRVLHELTVTTRFWSRGSADGRYFAAGASPESVIVDLERSLEIAVDAAYDPGFFPDNSGFMFQGTPDDTSFCVQSVLDDLPEEEPRIDFSERGCSPASIGLYQHMGAALDGGDYFVVAGDFESDNGGHGPTTENPSAWFGDWSELEVTPLAFDGSEFTELDETDIETPFEGDTVISPSTTFLISRVGNDDAEQTRYALRELVTTKTESGYEISAPEVGTICAIGGKPAFSFDERYLTYHHYVDAIDWASLGFESPDDPGFVEYRERGAANVFVVDLMTGEQNRVTLMSPGQYALYPHFRSDGWLVFLVRDSNTGVERIAATDAVLRVSSPQE